MDAPRAVGLAATLPSPLMARTYSSADPYRVVIRAFNRVGVRYVVVGMAGINYYAKNPAATFGTMDYDLLLKPTLPNVRKALVQLQHLKFSLGTSAGLLVPQAWDETIRQRRTVVATTPDGLMVELLLQVSGYTFEALADDAATITIHGTPIIVGRLNKLLRSKRAAGRPKDRAFLARYQALLDKPLEP